MARITVIGGTGYTGGNIAKVAATRTHDVTAYSRTAPAQPLNGVVYLSADLLDPAAVAQAVAGAEVVVSALSPRGALAGRLVDVDAALAKAAANAGARLVIVGGFGALRPAAGAPRIVDSEGFPAEYRAESQEMVSILEALQKDAPTGLDWLFVSPSAGYGAYNPGEPTGTYRVGGDIVAPDAQDVPGADFALAIVEEIENPAHQGHISVFV